MVSVPWSINITVSDRTASKRKAAAETHFDILTTRGADLDTPTHAQLKQLIYCFQPPARKPLSKRTKTKKIRFQILCPGTTTAVS